MAQAVAQLDAIAGDVTAQMRSALKALLRSKGADDTLTPEDIADAVRRVSRIGVTRTTEANRIALATAEAVNKFNRRDVRRAIGIDVPEFSAPLGERWRREHIQLIKSLPEEAKARFTNLLRDASKKQTRVETIARALEEQEGITHRRARLIARDQVLTLNAKLNKDRQQRAGIEEYEWLTMRTSSVRHHHAALDGKRFRYDKPPLGGGTGPNDHGNPGDGIGCMCQGIPVIPEFEAPKPEPKPKPQPKPLPKPEPRPRPLPPVPRAPAPAPAKFQPVALKPEEKRALASSLVNEFKSLKLTSPTGAPLLNAKLGDTIRDRMKQHGVSFERANKGIFTNHDMPSNQWGGAYVNEHHPLHGRIELHPDLVQRAEDAIAEAQRTGLWEDARYPLNIVVHEETHLAASVRGSSYGEAPEHSWIEEATTELASQRITAQWIGTKPLEIKNNGFLNKQVAYQNTITRTIGMTSGVLGVSMNEALEIVTQAGLAMRRPGDQTRTYLQAFLDGLPETTTRAQKDALATLIRTAAQAKVPAGAYRPTLDAKVDTRDWAGILWRTKTSPTAEQVEAVLKASGAKSITSGDLHYVSMAGLSGLVADACKTLGIEIVDDGNTYY